MWWRWWVVFSSLGVLLQGSPVSATRVESAPALAPSTILIDADSGQTLSEADADAPYPSGGLNQLMVLLLAIEQTEMGTMPLTTPVTVSPLVIKLGTAAQVPLHADKTYLLGDLMMAMAVGAAVDATVAVAETVAGSVPTCLEMMNARAQRLGMAATRYTALAGDRPDGIPASDTTTARDVARLAQALLRHKSISEWASVSGFPFDHGATLLRNTNQLLGAVNGVDGLLVTSQGGGARGATGRTTNKPRATFDIVATAQRQSLRLAAVVLGAGDSATRYGKAAELIEWGFAHYERLELVKEGERLNMEVRVSEGAVGRLTPIAGQAVSLLRRRDEERDFQVRYQVPALIAAPVKRDQVIGELIVEEHGRLMAVVPVLSPRTVAGKSILSAALR